METNNNHMTIEDLAIMVKRGFDQTATKEDLKELATKVELNYVKVDLNKVKADLSDVKVDLNEVKVELNEVKVDLSEVKIELNEVKGIVRDIVEELNAMHADVRHIRSTTDALVHSDIVQESAIEDLTSRVHRVEKKVGFAQ